MRLNKNPPQQLSCSAPSSLEELFRISILVTPSIPPIFAEGKQNLNKNITSTRIMHRLFRDLYAKTIPSANPIPGVIPYVMIDLQNNETNASVQWIWSGYTVNESNYKNIHKISRFEPNLEIWPLLHLCMSWGTYVSTRSSRINNDDKRRNVAKEGVIWKDIVIQVDVLYVFGVVFFWVLHNFAGVFVTTIQGNVIHLCLCVPCVVFLC